MTAPIFQTVFYAGIKRNDEIRLPTVPELDPY